MKVVSQLQTTPIEVTEFDKLSFRDWHVESLLNQAAELLDRCMAERDQWFDLSGRHKTFLIDEYEVDEKLKLANYEEAHGLFSEEYFKLEKQIQNIDATVDLLEGAKTNYDACSYYAGKKDKDSPEKYSGLAQSYHANYEVKKLRGERAMLEELKNKYEGEGHVFLKKESLKLANVIHERRKKLYSDPQSPLYLDDRITSVQERFLQSFKDAYIRLTIAATGLERIYGYREAMPHRNLPSVNVVSINSKVLDQLVIWLRDAMAWLTAFSQLDQAVTVILSLRDAFDKKFDSILESNKPIFHLPLDNGMLNSGVFKSYTFLRLRGISAFASSSNLTKPIYAVVRPPNDAISLQQIFSTTKKNQINQVKILQKNFPSCYLGRIETRNSPRPPEVCGMISLMNASPIPDPDSKDNFWTVDLQGNSKEILRNLTDLQLELNLLGRPLNFEN